jgi:hypothetical protein
VVVAAPLFAPSAASRPASWPAASIRFGAHQTSCPPPQGHPISPRFPKKPAFLFRTPLPWPPSRIFYPAFFRDRRGEAPFERRGQIASFLRKFRRFAQDLRWFARHLAWLECVRNITLKSRFVIGLTGLDGSFRQESPYCQKTRVRPKPLENPIMSTTIKVEILSICAAFAFITAVLVAVW